MHIYLKFDFFIWMSYYDYSFEAWVVWAPFKVIYVVLMFQWKISVIYELIFVFNENNCTSGFNHSVAAN